MNMHLKKKNKTKPKQFCLSGGNTKVLNDIMYSSVLSGCFSLHPTISVSDLVTPLLAYHSPSLLIEGWWAMSPTPLPITD